MRLNTKGVDQARDVLNDRTCPVCGKEFVTYGAMWGYKIQKRTRTYYMCSWSCLKVWKAAHETRGQSNRKGRPTEGKIRAVLADVASGMSIAATGRKHDLQWTSVKYYIEKHPDWYAEALQAAKEKAG